MNREAVVLFQLLGHDEPLRDHDARGGEEGKGEPEREPEELCLVRNRVDRVDDRNSERTQGRAAEQDEHEVLGAPVRSGRRHDATGFGARVAAACETARARGRPPR